MADTEAMYQRWKSLVYDGYDPQAALNIVRTTPARAKASAGPLIPEGVTADHSDISTGESVGRGAAQSATLGFGDEAQGIIQAVGNRALPVSMGGRSPDEPQPSFAQDYRNERDAARAENESARAQNPKAYIGGELGGTLVTAPLVSAGKGVGGAIKAGAKLGAAIGLGNSKADLTTTNTGAGVRAVGDTALGALIGMGAGALGHGIIKGLSAGGRAAVDKVGGWVTRTPSETVATNSAARDIANNIAENASTPSALQGEGTVSNAFARSQDLVKQWSAMLKEPFVLSPSKMTGDRAAALAEQRLQQFGPTMNAAQASEAKLVEQTGKLLDMHVNNIAANPDKLARGDVADQLGEVLKKHISSLYDARAAAARPLYDAAEKAGGGVNADGILTSIRDAMARNAFDANHMNPLLRKILAEGEARGAGGGLSISEANAIRRLMSEVIQGDATLMPGVGMSAQSKAARGIMGAVDQAFDETVGTSSGPGVDFLRRANAAWAAGSRAIKSANTETVQSLLAKAGTDSAETIPKQLLSLKPRQVEGVFRILNAQADKSIAQDVRAQMFHEALTAAGAADAESIALANGVNRFSPAQAMSQFYKAEPALRAAYAGDNKALHSLADTFQLLKRVNFGPNLKGSPTYAYSADDAMQGLAAKGAERVANAIAPGSGGVMSAIMDRLGAIFSNPAASARAVSTPEGIQAVNKALRAALQAQNGKVVPQSVAQDAARALTQITSNFTADFTAKIAAPQQQDEPPPPPQRPIAQQ